MGLEVFRLDGRVSIVTGGSKGLGEAMAMALAGAGSRVVIVSRNLEESQQVADRITAATRQETLALKVDVTRKVEVEQMAQGHWPVSGESMFWLTTLGLISASHCWKQKTRSGKRFLR